jgi:hypothetical protein
MMKDSSEQFHRENSSEFPDDAIRRFLLGQLSVAERLPFEEKIFTDDGLETRIHLAEYELADDYAFGRLSVAERKLFEQKFLLSIDRKRKLRVSEALRDRSTPFEAKTTIAERVSGLIGLNRPVRKFAFVVVMLLLLMGTFWLVVKEPRVHRVLFRRASVPEPTPITTPEDTHHGRESGPPSHHETASPMPPHEPTLTPKPNSAVKTEPTPAVSVVLLPAIPQESGKKAPLINLPKGEHNIVRLELSLKPRQARTYRAELLSISGESVFAVQSLNVADSNGARIYVDVAAGLLRAGHYQIKLSRIGDGATEPVATYYFRAQ